MPINILPYPGDEALLQALEGASPDCPLAFQVFEQSELCVVLGKGNDATRELCEQSVLGDGIVVYRREGGGGSVVLAPGMLIVAVAAQIADRFGSKRLFGLIQAPIQEALEASGIRGVSQRGLSDLACEGRKILGSSMRRQGTILMYQAVLLVDMERSLFSRYLQHPPREPDYREGRGHESFTVCLRELGYQGDILSLQHTITAHLSERLPLLLKDEFVPASALR